MTDTVPSILEQTWWPSGLFMVPNPTTRNSRYFNPTAISAYGSDWLIARHSVPGPPGSMLERIGMNDLEVFQMGSSYALAKVGKVTWPRKYKKEHFEDPRAAVIANRVFVSCTNFQLERGLGWHGSHSVLAMLDETWKVAMRADPVYGLNGASPYQQIGSEKNWLWFEYAGRPHMVYTAIPHQVAVFAGGQHAIETHATKIVEPQWNHGPIRGGTPPVKVGDEYLTFFHSSTPWQGKRRRYHMGAYAFSAEPPFYITRMTLKPLLSGSQHDPWSPGLPLVVFPGGAIYRGDKWLVVFGVNDCACGWIEIPHQELCGLMESVEFEELDTYTDIAGRPMTSRGEPLTRELVPV